MEISSVNTQASQTMSGGNPMAKMKQLFQNLGSALASGNLSDAKNELEQLQKNTPAGNGNGDNPITAKVEKMSKAINSGDLKGAQDAYADIKKTMSQQPAGQGRAGGTPPGGTPPSGAKQESGASSSSSTNKDYDKKDLDKDGTVSAAEEFLYNLQHPEAEDTEKSSTAGKNDQGSIIDTTA